MKKSILLSILLIITLSSFSQSYLGWITSKVNFREQPSTDASIISSLKSGTQIFIISLDTEGDFYNIIDIKTNTEGYVSKKFVKVGKLVKESDNGIFTPSGESTTYNPKIEIFNNTNITLTLKLNSETYTFSSGEKHTINMTPGTMDYRASAPGVIPKYGKETVRSNQDYTWQFFIKTSYR